MARNKKAVRVAKSGFDWEDKIGLGDNVIESDIEYEHLNAQVFQVDKKDITWAWVVWYDDKIFEVHANLSKGWHMPEIDDAKDAVEALLKVLVKRDSYTSDY